MIGFIEPDCSGNAPAEAGTANITCLSCAYFARLDEAVGDCRIRPPEVLAPLLAENPSSFDLPEPTAKRLLKATRFPVVSDADWCGQHSTRREEPLPC